MIATILNLDKGAGPVFQTINEVRAMGLDRENIIDAQAGSL